MTKDEIIEMAKQVGFLTNEIKSYVISPYTFAKLVAAKAEARYMQLFLDPENQPTQFGTETQEFREKEVKEVQDLLTDLAHHVRTKHHYGMEVQKMLEKEAAIRARGEG